MAKWFVLPSIPLIYLWNANSNNLQQTCKYQCGLLTADLTAGAPRPKRKAFCFVVRVFTRRAGKSRCKFGETTLSCQSFSATHSESLLCCLRGGSWGTPVLTSLHAHKGTSSAQPLSKGASWSLKILCIPQSLLMMGMPRYMEYSRVTRLRTYPAA